MGQPTIYKSGKPGPVKIESFIRHKYMPYKIDIALDKIKEIGNLMIEAQLFDIKKQFTLNRDNTQQIRNLIMYIHGDPSSELDLYKSLGFIGRTGTGKTMMFNILIEYMKIDDVKYLKNGVNRSFNFKMYSSRQIVSDFAKEGFDGIEKYLIPNIMCIDDLGSENPNSLFYGNKINVVEHLLEERYMMKKITHFSSNFTLDVIGKTYGERVKSRISEKTNLIVWAGKDFRVQ